MLLDLHPGDIVCTTYCLSLDEDDPNWAQAVLSLGIRWTQCFNDYDGKAHFTHTFFITDRVGTTFEALWTYRHQNIYDAYAGQEILIGRHKDVTQHKFNLAYYYLKQQYEGQRYPGLKLPLFLLCPRMLKYLPGRPVCSELTAKLLYDMNCMDHWRGLTPSYIADMIRRWKKFDIVYHGHTPSRKGM